MSYEQVFGLPENNNVENILPNVIYGFTYYNPHSEVWRSYIGTFPYLYGVFQTVMSMNEEELYFKTEEGDVGEVTLISGFTFLYIDQQYNPIKLIGHARIDPVLSMSIGLTTGMAHGMVLRDLSSPGYGNVPRMEFEF